MATALKIVLAILVIHLHCNRDGNEFTMDIAESANGVYMVDLPTVQNEHVVLFDNTSIFGDIIYEPVTGYKQNRIRALGYISDDWDGSLNIKGFIFDKGEVVDWEQYKDYDIGTIVKYKEFYYSANVKIIGQQSFNAVEWKKLDPRPNPN